jgi:hypothetical protein
MPEGKGTGRCHRGHGHSRIADVAEKFCPVEMTRTCDAVVNVRRSNISRLMRKDGRGTPLEEFLDLMAGNPAHGNCMIRKNRHEFDRITSFAVIVLLAAVMASPKLVQLVEFKSELYCS